MPWVPAHMKRSGAARALFEEPGYLEEPAAPGVLEWCEAIAIRELDVGAGVDQEPDDLLVCWAPVAEDDCLQEGSPAELVHMVDWNVGLEQGVHHPDMAAVGRRDERGTAEAVRASQVWLGAQHLSQHLDVAGLTAREERVVAVAVLEVDVRVRIHQKPDHLRMLGERCRGDCGPTAGVTGVDIDTGGDRPANCDDIA